MLPLTARSPKRITRTVAADQRVRDHVCALSWRRATACQTWDNDAQAPDPAWSASSYYSDQASQSPAASSQAPYRIKASSVPHFVSCSGVPLLSCARHREVVNLTLRRPLLSRGPPSVATDQSFPPSAVGCDPERRLDRDERSFFLRAGTKKAIRWSP